MSRSVTLWRLACAGLVFLSAGAAASPAASIAVSAIELTDVRGRSISLAQPAQRIVALSPHFVENLYLLGAQDQIVGSLDSADYPEAAREFPSVGSYNSISPEAVVALKPDLVLAWQSGNSPRVLAKLEALGLTVFVEEPRTLSDVSRSLLNLGKLSGHAEAGLKAMSDFDQRLAALRQSYGVRSQVSVFYEVWHAPLQTLNGEHVVSALIEACGGHNIFAEAIPLAPQVGMEAVIARQPQVIIVGGSNQAPHAREIWQRWSRQLPAVAKGHIYEVRADWIQRFTPRMLDGAQQLCEALDHARHP